jgi:hypothetical protein
MGRGIGNDREAPRRGRRRVRPGFDPLEGRVLFRVTGIKVEVFPDVLPPVGRFQPVLVKGVMSLSKAEDTPPLVNYTLIDEYRQNERRFAPVHVTRSDLGPDWWEFQFTVNLDASASANNKPGRNYFFIFAAKDRQEPTAPTGKFIPVLVVNPTRFRPPRPAAPAQPHVPAGPRGLRMR